MTRATRSLAAPAVVVLSALALVSCGGDAVPGNAVAKIDDSAITRTEFNRWMEIAALSTQPLDPEAQEGAARDVVVPTPPDFTKCIAQKREAAPKPEKGQPTPSTAQFKQQCEQEYESLKDQVMQFLISAAWIRGEAEDQDVSVSDAEIKKQFNETKKQSFPEEKDFQEFLKTSGMTLQDLYTRVELDLLSTKLRDKITEGLDEVSNEEIRAYYNENKEQFSQPERRDLRIVLTETREDAVKAKNALESGESFSDVAKRYSIDEATKDQGGVLLGVAKGQQEQAFDEAIFSAEKGELTGPVKTQFGYYVFQVQKITEPSQQTVQQAADTIRQLLVSQGQQEALDTFVEDFREKWVEQTHCRDGFIVQDCENAPEPEETATGPAGAQPPPGVNSQQVPTPDQAPAQP